MDPLVVAALRMPIVFFMTRSDVFTPLTRPILWMSHMLPIFRQHDGVDTKDANEKVFLKCTKVLSYGRNLLIFGEGFTDDKFVRRLKPVKKGAVRIGFSALESMNWKKNVYMAAVGCNYSDPNQMRSDLLISTSKKICLNDFKDAYLENPNKTITEVTKLVEKLMKDQITHVDDIKLTSFHENIMILTRKGMNALHSNLNISLIKRWHYSQKLAIWINNHSVTYQQAIHDLQEQLSNYLKELDRLKINDNHIYEYSVNHKLSRTKELLMMVVLFPIMLIGLAHCGIPYYLVKKFVERTFKRRVFWGSVKLLLGMLLIGLLNIPVIFLFHAYIFPSYWLGFVYYLSIGLFGLAAYTWFRELNSYRQKTNAKKVNLPELVQKRMHLLKEIHRIIPVA